MKICTKCKIKKLLEEFSPDKRRKDGKTSRCKICLNRFRNKEKINIQHKKHYLEHKEEISVKNKKWRLKNKAKLKKKKTRFLYKK